MTYWNTGLLFREDRRYAYAASNVRALETALLDRAVLERIGEAKDMEAVGRILAETPYNAIVTTLGVRAELEKALEAEQLAVLALAEKHFISPRYMELIRARSDFHNLRVVLKQKYLGGAADVSFAAGSSVPAETLRRAVASGQTAALPRHLSDAITGLLEVFNAAGGMGILPMILHGRDARATSEDTNQPGQPDRSMLGATRAPLTGVMIDEHVDQRMFGFFLAAGKRLPSKFFLELARLEIDLYNIGTMLRARRRGAKGQAWTNVLADGGAISLNSLAVCAMSSIEEVPSLLFRSDLAPLVQDVMAYLDNKGSFARYERLAKRAWKEFIALTKFVFMGPEPVFAFTLLKLDEIRALRLLIIGKQNKIDDAVLAEYAGA